MSSTPYTYTIEQWQRIADGLLPERYTSHKILADIITSSVGSARERNQPTITLYPFGQAQPIRRVIDRRLFELGLDRSS